MPAEASQGRGRRDCRESDRTLFPIAVGVFSFAVLTLVLSRLGVPPLTSLIVAMASGTCLGLWMNREGRLNDAIQCVDAGLRAQLAALQERHEVLYRDSVACCVLFDAGTRVVQRASPGFYEVFGIDAGSEVQGKPLEGLVGMPAVELEALVRRICEGRLGAAERIDCRGPDGRSFSLQVSAYYLSESCEIEMMLFYPPPLLGSEAELERELVDVERVRRGLVHRELRILELKEEVNTLLRQAHQPVRYKVDLHSKDAALEVDGGKEGGGE